MRFVLTILTLYLSLFSHAQSILSSGQWYKIGISETGIYKIDRSFLSSAGINPNSINPQFLRLYGRGGGGMLPQANSTYRPNDPQEIGLYAQGMEDGSFDHTDYFLFFSEGPDRLELDEAGYPVHEKNIYCDTVYYFLTVGEASGKRISTIDAPAGITPSAEFTEYFLHETDVHNQLNSGRRWLGESFGSANRTRSFSFEFDNPVSAADIWVSVAATLESVTSFEVSLNGTALGTLSLNAIPDESYGEKVKYSDGHYVSTPNSNELVLSLTYDAGHTSGGYLDYFILAATHPLSVSEEVSLLRIPPGQIHHYALQNLTDDAHIWDVSDPTTVRELALTGSSFSNTADQNKLAIFQGDDFPTPEFFHTVPHQNIKGYSSLDGVIVTHPAFVSEAERLAEFHRSHDQLSVAVVTTRQVYNEFSSGSQDLTAIRDFLRYHYLKDGTLKYALLFGDASFDYKNLKYQRSLNTNYVPVYESFESSHNVLSHSSDDYIGFMEEGEGAWDEGVRNEDRTSFSVAPEDHTLELGIGRLPAKTTEEAEDLVDKIIRYKTASQSYGKWRTQLAYLADDGDNNEHMKQSETFNAIVDTGYYAYNSKRIYLDSYDQSGEPGLESPVSQAVLKTLKDGVLIFDYMGHGNANQLTDYTELAINTALIQSLTNRHKLPLFVTATCEFGQYDNPTVVSGAEMLLLNPNGGAIGLLSTSRYVYAHTNKPVNIAFHENVFERINGEHPRLGDVVRKTKNESLEGLNNRNFSLLGDPMLRLNYPEYEILLEQFEEDQDTLSALEQYRLSGRILSENATAADFNGQAIVTVWDIPQEKLTKGDENPQFTYTEQTNALFRGEFTVQEGTFDAAFILPKNMSYKYEPGKITVYAWNADSLRDAATGTKNFVLGGTATNSSTDTTPPSVALYLNDSATFRPGGTVGPSSLFIARLFDENGINISDNGFTQGITLQLNDGDQASMNEYYTANQDTYRAGTVVFPLENLAAGRYTATLKVSDTYNNSTQTSVEFKVSDKPILRLFDAKIYPNPTVSDGLTTFTFTHDREGEELEVSLILYDMHGSSINQWEYRIDSSPREIDNLTLRMSNSRGERLHKGIYLCRLTVRSTLDGASNEVIKRLVIIN